MIDNELFFVRDEKGPILYAPLIGFSARVNAPCMEAVARKLNGEDERPEDMAIIEYLSSFGLFDKVERPKRNKERPAEITLFPSDGCNLRCKYCYASAEKIRHTMPLEVGKAAVDHIVNNYDDVKDILLI